MGRSSRDRSRSPFRHERKRRRRSPERESRRKDASESERRVVLPFKQQELTKHDLQEYRPMFTLYLDIQKQIDLEGLEEDEVKGRWKSFVKKWNRKELAEGWYDPATLAKAKSSSKAGDEGINSAVQEESDSDDYGPAAPRGNVSRRRQIDSATSGPGIPSVDDIRRRDEDARYEAERRREEYQSDMTLERKHDQRQQNERLDEIAPRADPGTRERQLEKKQDIAASNRAFAASKETGDVEVPESDLMGEDSLSQLKRMKKEAERKKSEREIKRDEFLRARAAEREERSQRLRDKEAKTMDMLKELAKARFGEGVHHEANLRE